jgi:hypothetical protein
LNVLKIEEIQQMTVSGLADLQLQDPNPWPPSWKILLMEIMDWLSQKLQKILEYPLVHATQF